MPSDDLSFRPMTADDIEEYRSWFSDPELSRRLQEPTPTWIRYVLSPERPLAWAVLQKGDLVGHIQVEFGRDRCSIALVVKPVLRGRRLSTAMISEFLRQVVPDQKLIEANIEQDNIPSIRCFVGAGFIRVSRQPDADGFLTFELRR